LSRKETVLIIATSGRLLAQLAKEVGYIPLVIDCFADVDTHFNASCVVEVGCLGLVEVKQALRVVEKQYSIEYVIYGSGFENHLNTLQYLEQIFTVLGNSFNVFSIIQNKKNFFSILKQYLIPYPEVSFQVPTDNYQWLLKPLAGEGGVGIRKYTKKIKNTDSCYWQRYILGTPRSVLFIADSEEHQIIGFHKQFIAQINEYEFVFSGLISQPETNQKLILQLEKALDVVVSSFKLKGINSLDYIEREGCCYILEVNARPSASLNLYGSELFKPHLKNCLINKDLINVNLLKTYQAYKIIFAEQAISIKEQLRWPKWAVDIPRSGSIINTGEPICSIIAGGKNEQQVEDLLLSRQQQLMNLINR